MSTTKTGRGRVTRVFPSKGYAFVSLPGCPRDVYLALNTMLTWPGWRPGVAIELAVNEQISCQYYTRQNGQVEITKITEYFRSERVKHTGVLIKELLTLDKPSDAEEFYKIIGTDGRGYEICQRTVGRLSRDVETRWRFSLKWDMPLGKQIRVTFECRDGEIDLASIDIPNNPREV
jgi:hypothetical protein